MIPGRVNHQAEIVDVLGNINDSLSNVGVVVVPRDVAKNVGGKKGIVGKKRFVSRLQEAINGFNSFFQVVSLRVHG